MSIGSPSGIRIRGRFFFAVSQGLPGTAAKRRRHRSGLSGSPGGRRLRGADIPALAPEPALLRQPVNQLERERLDAFDLLDVNEAQPKPVGGPTDAVVIADGSCNERVYEQSAGGVPVSVCAFELDAPPEN